MGVAQSPHVRHSVTTAHRRRLAPCRRSRSPPTARLGVGLEPVSAGRRDGLALASCRAGIVARRFRAAPSGRSGFDATRSTGRCCGRTRVAPNEPPRSPGLQGDGACALRSPASRHERRESRQDVEQLRLRSTARVHGAERGEQRLRRDLGEWDAAGGCSTVVGLGHDVAPRAARPVSNPSGQAEDGSPSPLASATAQTSPRPTRRNQDGMCGRTARAARLSAAAWQARRRESRCCRWSRDPRRPPRGAAGSRSPSSDRPGGRSGWTGHPRQPA